MEVVRAAVPVACRGAQVTCPAVLEVLAVPVICRAVLADLEVSLVARMVPVAFRTVQVGRVYPGDLVVAVVLQERTWPVCRRGVLAVALASVVAAWEVVLAGLPDLAVAARAESLAGLPVSVAVGSVPVRAPWVLARWAEAVLEPGAV
ncbi:hypothetical protein D0T12_21635 [Actinomadura spongiicola]|uniref:Uncharacterized protein n=1 Tax=Actinomadura spongiicola TaxID=2303421 RepID=A0A372GE21_9ACTN|nr:hypothetical protein D0T12_21635 [Actinomadura spongiicola]